MVAVNDQTDELLTVREAAAVCRVGPRTIRRKLAAGEFPNARKSTGEAAASGAWRVPFGDLERAGLCPVIDSDPAPALPFAPPDELPADSEQTAGLRRELADSVATAEIMLMHEKVEKWRAIAAERERALERADATLAVLSEAIISMARAGDATDDSPVVAWPRSPAMASVPPEVRDAAMRYAKSGGARSTAPRRWWQSAR